MLGSGTILLEIIAAAELLSRDWGIASEIWSVTSFTELACEARAVERWNRLNPLHAARISHIAACLGGDTPVIAATDYVRAVPQLVASYIEPAYTVLGTDGFGRSDTRSKLRGFFEVSREYIVLAALTALAEEGRIERSRVAQALNDLGIDGDKPDPFTV